MQNLLPYTTVSKRNGITEGYFDLIKLQKKAAAQLYFLKERRKVMDGLENQGKRLTKKHRE